MKTLIDPKNHESVLAQWRDAHAKIWIFHVTHNRMAIILSRKDEHEAIYIVAVGCERLSGPFSWNGAHVSIITDSPNHWGEVHRHVTDKQAGFELVCSDVTIVRGPAAVPIDPFENFIGDAK